MVFNFPDFIKDFHIFRPIEPDLSVFVQFYEICLVNLASNGTQKP